MNTEKVAALSLSGSTSTDEVRMTGRDQKASRCLRSPTWAVWHSLSASQSTQKVEKVTLYQEDQTGTFDSPPPLKNTHSLPSPTPLEEIGGEDCFPEAYHFSLPPPYLGGEKGEERGREKEQPCLFPASHPSSPQPPASATGEGKLWFGYESAIFSWSWLSFLISSSDEEVEECVWGVIKRSLPSREKGFNTAQLGAGWETVTATPGLYLKELRLLNKSD